MRRFIIEYATRRDDRFYVLPVAPTFVASPLRSFPFRTPANSSGSRSGVQPKQGMPSFASVSANDSLYDGVPRSETGRSPIAFTPLSSRNSILLMNRFVLGLVSC